MVDTGPWYVVKRTFGENSAIRTALLDSWIWSLSLITLTIIIHTTVVMFMVLALHRFRVRLGSRSRGFAHVTAFLIAVFAATGFLLAVLHGIEAGLRAAAYWWLDAFHSPGNAFVYSIDSMATRGASGLTLQPHWQLMGALEAADGMLLFGISAAFIFTVMQFYFQHLVVQRPGSSAGAE